METENRKEERPEGRIPVKNVVMTTVLLALLIFILYFEKNYRLEHLEFRSIPEELYSYRELSGKILTGPLDSFAFFLAQRINRHPDPGIPFVEKLDAELSDRNTCIVYVYYKAVSGCFELMDEYMYFDRDGIIVESSPVKREDIPLIKGVRFKNIVLNSRPDAGTDGLYETIINLTLLLKKNGLPVESITFNDRNEAVLKTGDDEVRLGKRDSYDFQIDNLKQILDSLGEGSFVVDMRNYSSSSLDVTARRTDE